MIRYYNDLIQGSDEWLATRRGLLTASEMKHIITPAKLQYASNDKERAHLYEVLAQRISGYTEPSYVGEDMMRGNEDECYARMHYENHYGAVVESGFITNNKWGFMIGYSPDGLVGDEGLIECKSRRQKYQIETIINGEIPQEYMIQMQTGLLVSERLWVDFISYSGGLPMLTKRVFADEEMQAAIIKAATIFEEKLQEKLAVYSANLAAVGGRFISTERIIQQEISLS